LPPWPAYWLWLIVNEVMIAGMVVYLLRSAHWPANRRWLIAALWLGFFPIYIEQFMGQFSILMALLLWLVWRSDEREIAGAAKGRTAQGSDPSRLAPDEAPGLAAARAPLGQPGWRWLGAVAWGLSLTLKSFSAFLIFPYLRDRRFRRILLGIALALILCLPYLLARPADLLEFARLNFSPFSPQIYKGSFGLQNALRDLLSNVPATAQTPVLTLAGRTLSLEGLLLLGLSLVIVLAALWGTARLRRHPGRHALDLALWVSVFFLIFKSVWEYHYVMMLPALSAAYLVRGSRMVLVLGFLMALPTLFAAAPLAGADPLGPLASWPAGFRFLDFGVKAVPTVLFFGWCLRTCWRTDYLRLHAD